MSGACIRVAALAHFRDGASGEELLLVRKCGTDRFMLPGGAFEPGEDERECLARERDAEIGLASAAAEVDHLGRFDAVAANEPDQRVEATVYACKPTPPPDPQTGAEIAELRRLPVRAAASGVPLAPLVADDILPILARRSR